MAKRTYLFSILSLGLVFTAALAIGQTAPAEGAPSASVRTSMVVNTLEDEDNSDGDCSLREAIRAANDNIAVDACLAGDGVITDTITFDVSGTIPLTAQLEVAAGGPLEIDGGETITMSGGGSVRVMSINTGAEVTFENLSIVDGYASGDGGGIYNNGTLTISNSSLSGNSVSQVGGLSGGGGIYNRGTLTIAKSTLSINHAESGGGGIYNSFGVLFITDSSLSGNNVVFNGGAIMNDNATMTIVNSTISDNSAHRGGGINNYNSASALITNSTLSGNDAFGADGNGGGIRNYFDSTLTLSNSTLSGNSANGDGGGIFSDFTSLTMTSGSIIANSPSGGNCSGAITDGGFNIDSEDTCNFDPANGSQPNTQPLLGTLQDNGGPTLTHSLLYGSPAIDTGDLVDCPGTDQRGVSRPQDGDGDGDAVCDVGSFESNGVPATPTPTATPAACLQPPSGLVSWWPGDGHADDIWDGNDGSLVGDAGYGTGMVNLGFSIGNAGSILGDSPGTGFPVGDSARTIGAWVLKSTAVWDQAIFHYGTIGPAGPINYHLFLHEGLPCVGNGYAFGTICGPTSVADGNFHLVTGVYEGSGTNLARVYVDDTEVVSGTLDLVPDTGTGSQWKIGDFQEGGGSFNGTIDEVDIYNRALSASEIAAIYNAGSNGKCMLTPTPTPIETPTVIPTPTITQTPTPSATPTATATPIPKVELFLPLIIR
jgi:CSLREA domain-containing protein